MPTSRSQTDFRGNAFCFIHVPKTAGVTLTSLLEPFSDPYSLDEGLRSSIIRNSSELLNRSQGTLFWHITYNDLVLWYGERTMESLHSFAFVRNPWDWLVSMYHYIRDPKYAHYEQMIASYMTFTEFLHYWRAKRLQQADFFGWNGAQGVKKLYRFENLDGSLAELASDLDIPAPEQVPRLNVSQRAPYRQYYTRETARWVHDICPLDIEIGGYSYDDAPDVAHGESA